MTYAEAIQFLYDLQLFGAKLGLENPRRLARLAGDPQDGLRFIHVAGTNGKGSTCAMLESVYRAAGLRVGLFTSPHLVEFRERIRIDGRMISERELIEKATRMRELLKRIEGPGHPTFFEVVVVVALLCFAEANCDLVIWETGLGGRLDATNIVSPIASVITTVHLDHQEWLGETTAAIAAEKAGIIKQGAPVVTGVDDEEAFEVIRQAASAQGGELIRTTQADLGRSPVRNLNLTLLGEHQRRNAAVAAATVEALQSAIPVTEAALISGLESARFPGRFQEVHADDGGVVILDGAHNEAGVDALLATLRSRFPDQRPMFILGMLADKAWPAMCGMLAKEAECIHLAALASERSADAELLAAACESGNPGIPALIAANAAEALELSRDSRLRVVTGSLRFLGEAMQALGLTDHKAIDEKGLNDYSAA